MQIKVTVESVYGRKTIYPACEKALTFAAIAGTKSLTLEVIAQIKKLGYSIEVIQQQEYL